ncbi:MAG: sulfite exporter TauE/SafE family protein [Gammaproteobacteria bacterium]|nr:MAG: sulfite exporter TauE/SafE family protein [Gammaproteobacteria bacterium]
MAWIRLSPWEARGTSIALGTFTAILGTLLYARGGMIQWSVALWVALPSLFIAPLAASWSERFSPTAMRRAFGAAVLLGGVALLLKDLFPQGFGLPSIPFLLGVGVLEGLVTGVVGISGGPILAPLFVLGLGMPQQLAQGCSLAARIPASLASTWENWRCRHIRFDLLPSLMAGSLLGTWAGAHIALHLPEPVLRTLFALVLMGLALRYLRG